MDTPRHYLTGLTPLMLQHSLHIAEYQMKWLQSIPVSKSANPCIRPIALENRLEPSANVADNCASFIIP